jgi:hypothetical protein
MSLKNRRFFQVPRDGTDGLCRALAANQRLHVFRGFHAYRRTHHVSCRYLDTLSLINLLPLDGRAKQICRVIVIILGVILLLKYIAVF